MAEVTTEKKLLQETGQTPEELREAITRENESAIALYEKLVAGLGNENAQIVQDFTKTVGQIRSFDSFKAAYDQVVEIIMTSSLPHQDKAYFIKDINQSVLAVEQGWMTEYKEEVGNKLEAASRKIMNLQIADRREREV